MNEVPGNERRRFRAGLIAILLLASAASLHLGSACLRDAPLPMWDEAAYAFSGKYLHDAAAQGRWDLFRRYSMNQMEKPFLHGWMLAPAYALFGVSFEAARGLSVVLYAACAVLLYLLGTRIHRTEGWAAGLVAAGLFLCAPIVLQFSVLSMLEVPGAFVTLSALLVFAVARDRGSAALFALAGTLAAGAFLLKYNYGILLGLVIGVEVLLEGRPWRKKLLTRNHIALALPVAVAAVVWFSQPFPEKIRSFFAFTVNRASQEGVLTLLSLSFYPEAVVHDYFRGWGLAIFAAVGLVYSLGSLDNRHLRCAVFFFLGGVVLMTLHPYKLDRAVFTVVPGLYLAAGYLSAAYLDRVRRRRLSRRRRIADGAVLLLLVVPMLLSYFENTARLSRSVQEGRVPEREETIRRVLDALEPEGRNLVLGEFNEVSPSLIQFLAFERFGRVFSLDVGCPVPADVYGRLGVHAEFRASICDSLAGEIESRRPDVVVSLEVPPGSVFFGGDYARWNVWKKHLVACLDDRSDYRRTGETAVGQGAALVRVYRRIGGL